MLIFSRQQFNTIVGSWKTAVLYATFSRQQFNVIFSRQQFYDIFRRQKFYAMLSLVKSNYSIPSSVDSNTMLFFEDGNFMVS